jgi:hypothetical protein
MKFYKLTEEVAAKLRSLKLTAAEWRVWSFLITQVPFSDSYQELPDTLVIMEKCDVKKTTFYKAIAKLQEAELFDFQDKGFNARNLTEVASSEKRTTFRETEQLSEKTENSSEKRKTFRETEQLSEKTENQGLEPLQTKDFSTPQTIKTIQTNKIPPEAKPKNKIEEPKKEFLENKKLASKQIGFRELQDFETQLGRVGVKVLVYQDGEIIQNEKLTASAIFLGETSEELRSRSIRQFLGWIETKKNVQDIYAIFYISLKNFVESNS